eukprot:3804495-Alexandrium_andersonii.AAC.1
MDLQAGELHLRTTSRPWERLSRRARWIRSGTPPPRLARRELHPPGLGPRDAGPRLTLARAVRAPTGADGGARAS